MTSYNDDEDPLRKEAFDSDAEVDASTLGTPHARAVRAQVAPEVAEALLARLRARLTEQGLPGGDPAVAVASSYEEIAQPATDADRVSETETAEAPASPVTGRLGEDEVATLMEHFYARTSAEILVDEREEILARIVDFLQVDAQIKLEPAEITESTRLWEELHMDSLVALQVSTCIGNHYGVKLSPVHFLVSKTMGDVITEILSLRGRYSSTPPPQEIEAPPAVSASPPAASTMRWDDLLH
ncbi:acyl carrier protein [Mycolicibacterium sp. P1-18]|uniref:acyl carrier protein n=1 Tax=Mycolicibacterium sp. P1-18 TaxID=2024615 RepID=UPI001566B44D|nr:phosphopantetheine-binding protein [Mycolicibacterium sp. P1-18]